MKVNLFNIFFISSISIFFTACGGGSGSGGSSIHTGKFDMQISAEYTVGPGSTIVKNEENTTVEIVHIDGQELSTVKLLSGSATLNIR